MEDDFKKSIAETLNIKYGISADSNNDSTTSSPSNSAPDSENTSDQPATIIMLMLETKQTTPFK